MGLNYGIAVLIMSSLTFVIYGIDKYKAIKHTRRISEKTLFVMAFFLGATGAIFASFTFKHKSNQWRFKLFNLLFFIVHVIIGVYLFNLG